MTERAAYVWTRHWRLRWCHVATSSCASNAHDSSRPRHARTPPSFAAPCAACRSRASRESTCRPFGMSSVYTDECLISCVHVPRRCPPGVRELRTTRAPFVARPASPCRAPSPSHVGENPCALVCLVVEVTRLLAVDFRRRDCRLGLGCRLLRIALHRRLRRRDRLTLQRLGNRLGRRNGLGWLRRNGVAQRMHELAGPQVYIVTS